MANVKRPNILFLMTDQHRLDHVGYHGNGKIETPNIDRIAESVGFTRCQTVNPICTPARTALLTGKYTRQIGTVAMSGDLSLQHPTYTRALQKAGYHTSGIGKFHFLQTWKWRVPRGQGVNLHALRDRMKEYGFDFVWETSGKQLSVQNTCEYMKHLNDKGVMETYRDFVESAGPNTTAVETRSIANDGRPSPVSEEDYVDVMTADVVIDRIRNRPSDRPFFIFGSFCSPHKPMDPPARYLDLVPYEEEMDFIPGPEPISDEDATHLFRLRRAYRAMIRLLDDQVGRIFRALEEEGILDETVVLFTSDHGEMMGDHGLIQKQSWYRGSVTVPAAIRHPLYPGRRLNASPVEITDLTATILDLAGLDPAAVLSKSWPAFHDRVPCRSLMPIVRGEVDAVREFGFSECDGKWMMVQDSRWKYVRMLAYDAPGTAEERLFDLEADPEELRNLAGDPAYGEILSRQRLRVEWITDRAPAAQTRWAPLPEEGERYSYPSG